MPKVLDKKYITDPDELNDIRSFIADSIDRFTGKVSSLQEFAQKASAYSEKHDDRPIELEVVTIDGEERGLRLWFAEQPDVKTSPTYLAKHLDIKNEFGITMLREQLGIEQSESFESAQKQQSNQSKSERHVPDRQSEKSSPTNTTSSTQASEADDDDEDLDATPIVLDVKVLQSPSIQQFPPERSTPEKNSKVTPKNKLKPVNHSNDDLIGDDSDADDREDLEEDTVLDEGIASNEDSVEDIIGRLNADVPPADEVPPEGTAPFADEKTFSAADQPAPVEPLIEPIQEPNASTLSSHNPYKPHPLEEASNLAHRATTSGEHLSGVNLLGAVGQALAVGAAVEQRVVDEIKLRSVERQESQTWKWTTSIGERIQRIRETKQYQDNQVHDIVDTAAATAQRSEDLAERMMQVESTAQPAPDQPIEEPSKVPPLDPPESKAEEVAPIDSSGSRFESTATPPLEPPDSPEDFLANMTTLGDRVSGMTTELGLQQDLLQPLRFYPDESFNARLTRVERYLEQINQRLDVIERAVEKLEVELGIRQASPAGLTDEPELATAPLPVREAETPWVDRAAWNRSCGEHLLNYAESVNQANGNAPRATNGFKLAENRTLYLLSDSQDSHIASIAVEDENGNPVYSSVVESRKEGNHWTTSCNELTSDADRKLIASLPQMSQDYQKQQTAQALVTQLVSKYPDAFSHREERSTKAITVAVGQSVAYRFKVGEVEGQPTLLGVEASSDRPVLKASYNQQGWRVEQCDIPTEQLRAMMRSDSRKADQEHSQDKTRSPFSKETRRSRQQQRSERELD